MHKRWQRAVGMDALGVMVTAAGAIALLCVTAAGAQEPRSGEQILNGSCTN